MLKFIIILSHTRWLLTWDRNSEFFLTTCLDLKDSHCPAPKPDMYIHTQMQVFYPQMICHHKSYFFSLGDPFWTVIIFSFKASKYRGSLDVFKMWNFLTLPQHLWGFLTTCMVIISLFEEFFPNTKWIFINFDGIHRFSSPVETRKKSIPQSSTSPNFHSEVNTSLKYIGWFNSENFFLLSNVFLSAAVVPFSLALS